MSEAAAHDGYEQDGMRAVDGRGGVAQDGFEQLFGLSAVPRKKGLDTKMCSSSWTRDGRRFVQNRFGFEEPVREDGQANDNHERDCDAWQESTA